MGIGVLIKPLLEKDLTTILSVFPESPAAFGGLQTHDSILAVDGVPLVEGDEVTRSECAARSVPLRS